MKDLVIFLPFIPIAFVLLTSSILIGGLLYLLGKRWRATAPNQHGRRVAIVASGIAVVASPYLIFKAFELRFVLARVPYPLHVAWIEYRLEESLGFGPGGNETGFVVYRLTDRSAQWARSKGQLLADALPGGKESWHPTPVEDSGPENPWHTYDSRTDLPPHATTIDEYLDRYGLSIPIEKGRVDEANRAIQGSGSFYSYGPGGSVTIVDPTQGKVYFAYAG